MIGSFVSEIDMASPPVQDLRDTAPLWCESLEPLGKRRTVVPHAGWSGGAEGV
jgi:hypothetical protein